MGVMNRLFFKVPITAPALPLDVKAMLLGYGAVVVFNCYDMIKDPSYNGEDVIIVQPERISELYKEPLFWAKLQSQEIVSVKRFACTITTNIEDPDGEFSNDNTVKCKRITDSTMINGGEYISPEDYQQYFVLTPEYIDSYTDWTEFKNWIRGRNIESNFNLTHSLASLKEEVKAYYWPENLEGE